MVDKNKKVLVAVSGGVDSSVSAALLKKEGFLVAGAFMRCWNSPLQKGCQAIEDELMARKVCQKIGIPFYAFDFVKEYKEKVFGYFISEYKAGRTPNPDVMCNKEIKFGLFFNEAFRLGFDHIATGHYARIKKGKKSPTILEAKDKNKDQSYFLCSLPREKLEKIIFPIGDYLKSEVRQMARKFGLPNADRKDSQGICFVGKIKLEDFLKEYIKPRPGIIVDKQGKKMGRHEGLIFYTIGQRKGIKLAGGPYYVMAKDLKKNILIVSKDEEDLAKAEFIVEDINWFSLDKIKFPLKVEARIRYRQDLVKATLKKQGQNSVKVEFLKPQRAITSGQYAVFYKKGEMLGSGIIS